MPAFLTDLATNLHAVDIEVNNITKSESWVPAMTILVNVFKLVSFRMESGCSDISHSFIFVVVTKCLVSFGD